MSFYDMWRWRLIFIVFGCFSNIVCFSQNNFEFQQLRGENTSTQSITYAIAQDSVGNLWIASEEGVLKHNSKHYKVYNTYNGLPKKSKNRTTAIFIDSEDRIWIGLESGVCLYNPSLDIFELIQSTPGLKPYLVNVIDEDVNGNIWVGSSNGLWKVNKKLNRIKPLRNFEDQNVTTISHLNSKVIYGTSTGLFVYDTVQKSAKEILLDGNKNFINIINVIDSNVIIGTRSGKLIKLASDLKTFENLQSKLPITHPIKKIVKSKNSNTLYIGTDGDGLYLVDNDFSVINHFKEDANKPFSLSSSGIYDILISKENILWIATYGGGVNFFDSTRLPYKNIRHYFNDENSIATNFTRAIAKDTNGNIWFGTKKGISIWNIKANTWKHVPTLGGKSKKNEDIVLALETDGNYMWVGTYNDGLYKININTLQTTHYNALNNLLHSKVYTLTKDNNGNIWVGGIEADLGVIDKKNNITFYPIRQVKSLYNTGNNYILASGRHGVHKININTKEVEFIEDLKPNGNTLAYTTINSITQTKDDKIILGTNGEGLVFYDPKSRRISKLNIHSGFPSDIVQGIITSSKDNIWASTTRGLVNIKLSDKDTIINVFDKKDGLVSTEFNYGSYRKINDSLFAFGSVDGVTLFNPYNLKENKAVPHLVFDEFKLFNKKIRPGEKPLEQHINQTQHVSLKHNENSIEVGFTGVLHGSSSKIEYTYKLENFDQEWSQITKSNQATYTNLPSGDYIFKVKAINKYGVESEEKTLNISVLSPWWATTIAYVIYTLLIIVLIYTAIHIVSVIMKKKNADEQINFFNNITHEIKTPLTILISSLDSITEKNDTAEESKKRIKTTVKRINSLFEQMLNFQKFTSDNKLSLNVAQINLNKHIEKYVNNFTPLTKERSLQIIVNNHWQAPFFHFDKYVLDKILLNLISNAIKYSFKGTDIHINLYETVKKELKIEIEDKGLGIPKDQQKFILKRYYRARNVINSQRPGTGLGLMLVKNLLEKTGGSIDFVSEENKGTKFTIILKNFIDEYNKKIVSNETSLPNNNEINVELPDLEPYSDRKILIVEDNDELRNSLVNVLSVYFQIFEATNGKEGLEIASQIFPDIILTDLIMPEMDGMQMVKNLKNDITLNHIPVFMLTVLQNSAQKLESIEAGISEYIEKPIDIKFLLAKIVNTFGWQQKLREKYVHDSDTDSALLFRNKNDQDFLNKLETTVLENILNQSFSVHNLSASCNMSRTSLYMKLKNLVNLSPQDFIIHTKLKHAKGLLIRGEGSIKEVAYNSGFSNPKYFSTSFKKFYNMTPSSFIESLKKE